MGAKVLDAAKLLAKGVCLIGPAEEWKGACFAIATQFVEQKIVQGIAIYGHWTGPIAKGTMFDRGWSGFCRHGWVLLPDGRIVDPTRWVFEGCEPYVYVGPADHYDEGGNQLRSAIRCAPPPYDASDGRFVHFASSDMPAITWNFISNFFILPLKNPDYKPGTLAIRQVLWLANLSPEELGGHAKIIYQALRKHKLIAFVPKDNRLRIEREDP